MKKIVQWLVDDITLDLYQQDDFRRILGFFIRLFLVGYILVTIICIFMGWWSNLWSVSIGSIFMIFSIILYSLKKTGPAIFLSILTLYITATYSMYIGAGLHDVTILIFMIVLALASLLLRFPGFLLIYFLTIIDFSLVAYFTTMGYMDPFHATDVKGDVIVINAIVTVFSIIMRILGNSIKYFQKENFRKEIVIKEKDKEIEISREKIHFLYDHLQDIYFECELSGRIRTVSPQIAYLLQFQPKKLLYQNISVLQPQKKILHQIVSQLRSHEKVTNMELEVIDNNKNKHNLLVNASLVPFHHDTRIIAGTAVDITEQKMISRKITQLQKLDSLGNLAGGLAHDFNNLITVVNINAELMLKKIVSEKNSPLEENLEAILDATTKAGILTRKILGFSRNQNIIPIPVDLVDSIRQSIKISKGLLSPDISITTEIPENPVQIMADQSQVEQVMLNLIINARDALQASKVKTKNIHISLEQRDIFQDLEIPSLRLKKGNYLVIKVRDNGIGMSEKEASHIFEPFFTTKGEQGTGLGLASVYGIMSQNGGDILVDSIPGKGTTFTLFWPRPAAL